MGSLAKDRQFPAPKLSYASWEDAVRDLSSVLAQLSAVRLLYGVGTPEAAITAGIGALYVDTAGGAGTTLYVKESGTGNTGWVGK